MVEKKRIDTGGSALPQHIAIIMDGNGRWAKKRRRPRIAGHRAGVEALRTIVNYSATTEIKVLTVYAFSSENWRRSHAEVGLLMELFDTSLQQNVKLLRDNDIRLRFIGGLSSFPKKLRERMAEAENETASNTGLNLVIAVNYGGRWDITRACVEVVKQINAKRLSVQEIDESLVGRFMCMADLPSPDLFIRTGGEMRISNFLLWQLAYTELYFEDCLWPDFDVQRFLKVLDWYAGRERRFGRTSEQVKNHA